MKNPNKMKRILIIVGAALLTLSIVCFIGSHLCASSVFKQMGYGKGSAGDLMTMLEESEAMAGMFGISVSDMAGNSKGAITLFKLMYGLRIWCLVLGLLALGTGLVFHFLLADPKAAGKARAVVSHGVSSASALVKDTIDKTTVKCPNCGKVCSAKTSFCPSCGKKMIKTESAPRSEKAGKKNSVICPNCGKVLPGKAAFCSDCGCKVPEAAPKEVSCGNCGAKYPIGTRFCSKCGTALTAGARSPEPEIEVIAEKGNIDLFDAPEEDAVPVVHMRPRETRTDAGMTVKAVSEKKNPFMSKPKDL